MDQDYIYAFQKLVKKIFGDAVVELLGSQNVCQICVHKISNKIASQRPLAMRTLTAATCVHVIRAGFV